MKNRENTDLEQTRLELERLNRELQTKNEALVQEVSDRRRAEQALLEGHNQLEKRVEERTHQLRVANQKLKDEIENRKQMEEALIRAERMAAVGTLAGGVAHEFNNINTTILGFSELLLMHEGVAEDIHTSLARIRKAALRAKTITGHLLTFSGGRISDALSHDLVEVTRDSLSLISRELKTSGISVEEDFGEVPRVMIDANQIGQVIINLIINARHSLLDRDEQKIILKTRSDDRFVYLDVIDTGCGISKEDIPKAFTPFYSTKGEHAGKGSPQTKVKGTGLGLSVSHTIVTNHGGEILASSELGKGSTFTIKLPQHKPLKGKEEEEKRASGSGIIQAIPDSGNILVLDDEEGTRVLLMTLLQKHGHRVFCTASGNEALSLIKTEGIDLVFVDLQMPEMNGGVFLQKMRSMDIGRSPEAIILTGKPGSDWDEYDSDQDYFCMIRKPFELNDIVFHVTKALQSRYNHLPEGDASVK